MDCFHYVFKTVYLPGVVAKSYKTNEKVDLFVNLVRSSSTVRRFGFFLVFDGGFSL